MKLSIVIVNYKSRFFLQKCLKSIQQKTFEQNFSDFEIILVNNESAPLKTNLLESKTEIIENKKNLGFAKASNLGAKKAKGQFLLFLNPDTELFKFNFLKIFQLFKDDKSLGIIGGQLIESSTQKPQPWSCGKKTSLTKILFKHFLKKYWKSKHSTVVDWISGGVLLIRKIDFEKISGFDEAFFMYFEDQDLCLRIKTLKKICLFEPRLKVIHYNGKSWEGNTKKQKRVYRESQEYFFKKNYPRMYYSFFKVIRNLLKENG